SAVSAPVEPPAVGRPAGRETPPHTNVRDDRLHPRQDVPWRVTGSVVAASGIGGQAAFSIREGRPEDSARCQAIAVAAWQPIHDVRRRLLGPRIYQHVSAGWRGAKAADGVR